MMIQDRPEKMIKLMILIALFGKDEKTWGLHCQIL